MMDTVRPDFVEVARMIAGDPTPEWLVIGLEHFSKSEIIGGDKADGFDGIIQQTIDAADTLLKYLPAFQHLPFGIQCPPDVAVVLDALERLKPKYLDRLRGQKPNHRPKDVGRQMCADVVVEAWRFVHGKAPPYSEKLYDACTAYWLACGGSEIGEANNPRVWERNVLAAVDGGDGFGKTVVYVLTQARAKFPLQKSP
jgi:hypothetical protein